MQGKLIKFLSVGLGDLSLRLLITVLLFLLLPVFTGGHAVNVVSRTWAVLGSVPSLIVLRSVATRDTPSPGVDGSRGAAWRAREARVWGGVTSHLLALDTGGVGRLTRRVAGSGITRAVERLGGGVAGTGTSRGGGIAWSTGGVACSWRVDSTGTVARVAW